VTKFEGSAVIRACVTHGETTSDDVVELADALQAAAVADERADSIDGDL
jgi:hypothetical protein